MLDFLSTTLPTTPGYFAEGLPLAYLIATVITGLGLLIGSVIRVAGPEEPARQSASLPSPLSSLPSVVARITGMVDCKWANVGWVKRGAAPPGLEAYPKAQDLSPKTLVAFGDQLALASGLMEITYHTGAKVILQGPVKYEVEANGGYLSVGKLTGKLEKRGERRGERGEIAANHQIPNPKSQIVSPSPLSPLLSPLFVIRTPTATVTDLGTEFGVEVQSSGVTEMQVFRGAVEMRVAGADGKATSTVLRPEHGMARVEVGDGQAATVRYTAGKPRAFVRQIPNFKRIPIRAFNTGINVAEGQADPHWQIVATSNDPHFLARPALVSRADPGWLDNEPARSQWISLVGDASYVPNVTYTFRTAFDLTGVRPDTAILRGSFWADDSLRTIRLNGRAMAVRWQDEGEFRTPHWFSITRGFVAGTNVLEFDVKNGAWGVPDSSTGPMGLRVELEGSVRQDWEKPQETAVTK